MRGSEKDGNSDTYDISSIKRLTRKFHAVVVQNKGKGMYKNCVLHVQTFLGGLIRPTDFFGRFRCRRR